MSLRSVEMALSTPGLDAQGNVRQVPLGIRLPKVPEPSDEMNAEHMLINLGPQHPATHGVLRLVI